MYAPPPMMIVETDSHFTQLPVMKNSMMMKNTALGRFKTRRFKTGTFQNWDTSKLGRFKTCHFKTRTVQNFECNCASRCTN
uniref:Uncharacterized protein n=1 Tax=Caenorhabditis japonica TaxID=281687 RepID=A0A8R1HT06_CAEJA